MENKDKRQMTRRGKIGIGFVVLILVVIFLLVKNFMAATTFGGYMKEDLGFYPEIDSVQSLSLGENRVMSKSISADQAMEYTTNESAIERYEEDGDIAEEIEDRKIIKNGNISIVVESIEESRKVIEAVVAKQGGFISSSNFTKYNQGSEELRQRYSDARYTLRIPESKFEEVVGGLKGMAIKVTNERITGRDVTSEYQDLELRIGIKRAEEKQYREILARSTEIKDVLLVMENLNRVVEEIEMQEGRLKNLSSQVSMSTIYLNLTAKKDVEIGGVIWTPLAEVKEAFNDLLLGLKNIANWLIHFVIYTLPILLLWVTIAYGIFILIWKITGKHLKKFFGTIKEIIKNILYGRK